MLKLVADKNNNFIISDIDFYEEKSLPTINTLEEMQKQYPDKEIWFLTGSDNLKYLHTWDRAEDIVSKHKVLIMERENDQMDEIIENNSLLLKYKENFIELKRELRSNYSSTYIRNQIKANKSVRYLLPDEVYEYILQNKLYMEEIYD